MDSMLPIDHLVPVLPRLTILANLTITVADLVDLIDHNEQSAHENLTF